MYENEDKHMDQGSERDSAKRALVRLHRDARGAMSAGLHMLAREKLLLAGLVCEKLPSCERAFELAFVEARMCELRSLVASAGGAL